MPPCTSTAADTSTDTDALLRFNHALLAQALALAALHEMPGSPPYARPVGAHLRHVVEHYEALLLPKRSDVVDYDARQRDAALERSPQLARTRLLALQQHLAREDFDLEQPVCVRGLAGLAGEFAFALPSTIGRELVFVASHAVHHYALLAPYLREQGLPMPDASFGVASATAAHARSLSATTTHPVLETA